MEAHEEHYQILRRTLLLSLQTLLPRKHNYLWEDTIAAGEVESMRKWRPLGDAVYDLCRALQDFPPNEVAVLDAMLQKEGLPTLTALKSRWSRNYRRAIVSGKTPLAEDRKVLESTLSSPVSLHPAEKADIERMIGN